MTPGKVVTIYVRAPNAVLRTLSLDRIPEISDKEALDNGFAIDGDSLLKVVGASKDEILSEELLLAERRLLNLLEAKGCMAEFK